MKPLIIGSILAAIALFVWGFLFWAVPWPNPAYSRLDVDDEVALWESLRDHIPATGTYYLPDVEREGNVEAATARHEEGPLATLMVQAEGRPVVSPGIFLFGFLHMLITAFIMALILRAVLPALPGGYGKRVGFLALVGFAAAIWANLGEPIWNYHPWALEIMQAIYDWTSWIVAGGVLARFVKPQG